MRALITGVDGFAGRHLAALLAARGVGLHGLVRPVAESRLPRLPGIALHAADVTDADAVAAAVAAVEPDWVFHLAGIASVPAAIADPSAALRVNALGTQHLLAGVARHAARARVIVIGSADAYGAVPPAAQPVRERQPLQPRSPYGASKAAAEVIAGQWARGGGLDVVCVRAFNHTGPGQRAGFVCADFARQLVAIAAGTLPPRVAVGDLSPVRDFSDVRDVVAAYVALAEHGVGGAVYNVCSGVGRSVRSVLDALIGLIGVPVEVAVDPARLRPADVPAMVGDATALRSATGWTPRIAWEQTLSDLVASLR
jgi:GDP-4-dehydro-6-deoxy-D-mannose reductase